MYFINDVYGNPTSLSFYTTQATNLGYTEIQASNGDGCPFVVNRLDPQRDPSSGSFVGTDKWQYSSNDFSGTPPSPGSEYAVFCLPSMKSFRVWTFRCGVLYSLWRRLSSLMPFSASQAAEIT